MSIEIAKVGKRGNIVIPAILRQKFGLHADDLLIVEAHGEGILLKLAVALPIENYTLERQAEFLLSNAINKEDYEQAKKEVKKLGLNPEKIPHFKLPLSR